MNLNDRVFFNGYKLSKSHVIPKWFIDKSWGTVVYVGEFYIGVELDKVKEIISNNPKAKEILAKMGIKEPHIIGLTKGQQELCLTV